MCQFLDVVGGADDLGGVVGGRPENDIGAGLLVPSGVAHGGDHFCRAVLP
ncbi:hypothetical protein ACIQVK_24845 [Streptomyces sp. NPDC090493]